MEPTPAQFDLERFREVAMPRKFVLECLTPEGEWIDWGLYERDLFTRCDDGSYLCGGGEGSLVFIRCLRQDGSVVYVVDGGGDPYTYRLVPFPGGGYTESSG